jgi:hypothetical protein
MWWVEWEKKTLAVFFFLLNIPEFFFSFPWELGKNVFLVPGRHIYGVHPNVDNLKLFFWLLLLKTYIILFFRQGWFVVWKNSGLSSFFFFLLIVFLYEKGKYLFNSWCNDIKTFIHVDGRLARAKFKGGHNPVSQKDGCNCCGISFIFSVE